VSEVIEGAALKEGHIFPRMALLKAWCTGLTIATGGSVGREGPVAGIIKIEDVLTAYNQRLMKDQTSGL
jgi:hypothetical protein